MGNLVKLTDCYDTGRTTWSELTEVQATFR